MEDNVINLVNRRKIKYLSKNIEELDEVAKVLKTSIKSLTTYDKYSSVKRRIEDLFVLYQDIKRTRQTKLDMLERLKHDT